MSDILKVLINTILVSVPEEFFVVGFSLLIFGQFNFISSKVKKASKFNKQDILKFAFIVVSSALVLNIFRYLTDIEEGTQTILGILLWITEVVFIYRIFRFKRILKYVLSLGLSVILLAAIEFSYLPFLWSMLNMTMEEVNANVFMNFLVSIPTRIVQIVILVIIYKKKQSVNKGISFLKIITNNKSILVITTTFLISVCTTYIFIFKFINLSGVLNTFQPVLRAVVFALISIAPLAITIMYFFTLYRKEYKNMESMLEIKNNIEGTVDDIRRFIQKRNFEKIDLLLDTILEDSEKLSIK